MIETLTQDKEFRVQDYLARKALARALCLHSPYYLGKEVLGYNRFGQSHVIWDKWIEENVDLTGKHSGKYLILEPRETFKTTYFTISLSICLLLNNPELSIMIANERLENARDILKEIKRHFESNEKLRAIIGNWVQPNHWAVDSITVNRKKTNYKEPSVWATGIGSSVVSKHPDVILMDDIAGKKDKESEAGRAQTMSFFQDSWDLLKKDAGLLIMLGTRKHVNDIYWHVKDNLNPSLMQAGLKGFEILEMPAHDKAGGLNFPDILTEDKLRELRIVKEGSDGVDFATYQAEYELNPLDPKTQIFKQLYFVNHLGLKFSKLSQWTDPSLGQDKDSDFSAIIVVGKIDGGEHDGKCLVLIADIDRRPPTAIIKRHNQIYQELHQQFPDIEYQVSMEQNGFAGLKDFAISDSLKSGGEAVPTRGLPNTGKKESRIESLEPAITGSVLLFRKDYVDAPGNYKLLVEQLRNYPQGKKDGPDALQGAFKILNRRGPSIR